MYFASHTEILWNFMSLTFCKGNSSKHTSLKKVHCQNMMHGVKEKGLYGARGRVLNHSNMAPNTLAMHVQYMGNEWDQHIDHLQNMQNKCRQHTVLAIFTEHWQQ